MPPSTGLVPYPCYHLTLRPVFRCITLLCYRFLFPVFSCNSNCLPSEPNWYWRLGSVSVAKETVNSCVPQFCYCQRYPWMPVVGLHPKVLTLFLESYYSSFFSYYLQIISIPLITSTNKSNSCRFSIAIARVATFCTLMIVHIFVYRFAPSFCCDVLSCLWGLALHTSDSNCLDFHSY